MGLAQLLVGDWLVSSYFAAHLSRAENYAQGRASQAELSLKISAEQAKKDNRIFLLWPHRLYSPLNVFSCKMCSSLVANDLNIAKLEV